MVAGSWVAIVCATALSVGAGWLAWHHDRTYYATARFLIVAPAGASPSDAYYGNLSAMTRTVTYLQLAKSPQVTTRAIDELKSRQSPVDLAKRITMGPTDSALLEMQVSANNPDVARDTANAVARNMIEVSREMKGLDTAGTDLVLVDPATGATEKRSALYGHLVLGGIIGLSLSVVLVVAYGLAIGSVLDRKQVGRIANEAIIGKGGQ